MLVTIMESSVDKSVKLTMLAFMQNEILGSSQIIGFIPTKDSKQARAFYENILGLTFEGEDLFSIEFRSGANVIRMVKVQDFKPSPFALIGWEVSHIEKIVEDLNARGVTFEKYDGMEQDERGIWSDPGRAKVAWFKDPDGNLLSISYHE